MSAVLRLESVTYAYAGDAVGALHDVSLTVEPGEFVVLAGGTGSGKSTVLRAASGLVPHFHGGSFEGRVVVGGLDTREHGPADIAAVAGTLFQEPETQIVLGTVGAELAFPLENRGLGGAAVARGVEEAALALGIAHLLDRPTAELSGGELQRVALGAALVTRPALVLLDEPTSQLDPVAGDELLGVLRRLNEEWGTAVLLAEHRLERCLSAADRVVAMRDGRVACDDVPQRFLAWAAREAPDLQTPGARLFALAGLGPPPVAVKDARAALRARGVLEEHRDAGVSMEGEKAGGPAPAEATPWGGRRRARRAADRAAVLDVDRAWLEPHHGPPRLRGTSLQVAAGEMVALMGRNGAGKSTLLRLAAGLETPTRGRVRVRGRAALLLQTPGDYFVHDRVADELPAAALHDAGLTHLANRHPRDLSGGERQRLAIAVVCGGEPPAVLLLDEPTRGMDQERKAALAGELRAFGAGGTAVVLATHDAELAVAVAPRTVLLGMGEIVADAPTAEVLGGGWYFATQTARILGGAALDPETGAAMVRARLDAGRPTEVLT